MDVQVEEVGKAVKSVENMIKSVFPQLINNKDDRVDKAKNYMHEICLKPATAPSNIEQDGCWLIYATSSRCVFTQCWRAATLNQSGLHH